VHPVVRGYVESKLDAERMRDYHLQAVEFYVSQHEDILSRYKIDRPKPILLAQITNLAAQQGQTQLAQTLTVSLLEMHHHLFTAGEYEQAGGLVNSIQPFLDMTGRREVSKALLHQSIASSEDFNKCKRYFILLYQEGKWQDALATYQESIEYYESIGAKKQVAVAISQLAQIYQDRGE
jgi:tetratricopeptide (TPR) repeat protein